jgi:UDP-N-acetylmuramate dehydrogenase
MSEISANASLHPFNTFGMHANARWFTCVRSLDDIQTLVATEIFNQNERLILGGGSNMLLIQHFDGLVIKNELFGIEVVREDADAVYVRAGAGENWHAFVQHTIAQGWGGLENLSLIPGNVGAAPMQNIGAYGVEIKDCFHALEAFHWQQKEVHQFDAMACQFGYRESVFKHAAKNQYLILNVTFRLLKNPTLNISYGAISKELETMQVVQPTIRDVSNAVMRIRQSKLPDPKQIGNAGSFFKNPVVSAEKYTALLAAFPNLVAYKNSDTEFKLAAGWLIEQCGWKGQRFGDAGVHKDQALVLVNHGNASGKEIFDLSQRILDTVEEKFGVLLEREVNMIGL